MSSNSASTSRNFVSPDSSVILQWLIALLLCLALHELNPLRWIFICGSISLGCWAVYSIASNPLVKEISWKKWMSLLLIAIPSIYLGMASLREATEHIFWAYSSLAAFGCLGLASAAVGLKTDDLRPMFRALVIAAVAVTFEGLWQMWHRTPDTGVLFAPERFWHQGNSLHVQLRLGSGTLPWGP